MEAIDKFKLELGRAISEEDEERSDRKVEALIDDVRKGKKPFSLARRAKLQKINLLLDKT